MENGDLYVQWFPGHMARTRRQIKESLPLVDAVVEIVDARVPVSSRNPELPELIGQKPLMVILNKCDLADENATRRRISELGKQGVTAIAVDCRSGKGLPTPATSAAATPLLCSTACTVSRTARHQSDGSCSAQPFWGW